MPRLSQIALLSAVLLSAHAEAQSSPLEYRFGLWGGWFFADVDTTMQWNGDQIPGTRIGLESNLGMKDNDSSFNGELEWRFLSRNALKLRFFDLKRNGRSDAPFELVIDGETIPINTEVSSSFRSKVTALSYAFSFIRRDNLTLDLGLGLSIQDLKFEIVADDVAVEETGKVTAPLPTINLGMDWAISPKWILSADAGWFDIKVDNVKGEITEFRTGVTWKAWEKVGINLAYNYFKVKGTVSQEEGDFEGVLTYRFNGPLIGVTATF